MNGKGNLLIFRFYYNEKILSAFAQFGIFCIKRGIPQRSLTACEDSS